MSLVKGAARAIGKLRPENSVFLLCDMQDRFRPLIQNAETVVNTSRYLTSIAKTLDSPVIVTEQYCKVFGHTVKECFADPEDLYTYPVIEKKQFSMCVDEVTEHMNTLDRENVILFGIEAHVCVQQTCLDLLEQGKEVHLVADAISSQTHYDREIGLQRMVNAGAYLTTSQSLAFMLMRTSIYPSTPENRMSTTKHGIGKLNLDDCVFLLCDIQERFRPLTFRGETVINTARYLTSVAKTLDVPIIITQQYTKAFGKTIEDCFEDPQDITKYPVIEKKKFSMCVDEVNELLTKMNKNTVILFGIEAHVCVQQTCLDLLEQGRTVHLVVDATSSQTAYDREVAFSRMTVSGAYLTTAQSLAFMLMRTAEHPNFKAVSKLTVAHMKLPNEFNEALMGKL
eukprot:Nitzschia sp. Nitz4//scaffold6_size259037//129514//131306//NITZ4_001077-RA/size259037-augustus-gene-0.293-mRNA-1//1//CDS//3329556902//8825//frame0